MTEIFTPPRKSSIPFTEKTPPNKTPPTLLFRYKISNFFKDAFLLTIPECFDATSPTSVRKMCFYYVVKSLTAKFLASFRKKNRRHINFWFVNDTIYDLPDTIYSVYMCL